MRTVDKRLEREVLEEIAVTSTFTETELDHLGRYERTKLGTKDVDRDHNLIWNRMSDVVGLLSDEPTSRQAIIMTDESACIVGVQILVRDYIHCVAWFRSSDVYEYRREDLKFLRYFARQVREELVLNKGIRVHVFTSSLHQEVHDGN